MKDLVSIIIPVYNAEKYIEETIESVLAQTYKEWELLLVDDGSFDSSCQRIDEYAKKDERIQLIRKENEGAAKARNTGVNCANGQYVAYLDADDLWEPEKLEKEIAFAKENQAAFCFTGYEFADENGKGTGKIVRVPKTLTYAQALKNTTIFTSTVLFDLRQLSKEDIMMPAVKSEDTALWWKILKKGHIAYGLNENLVKYRRVTNSLSSNKWEAVKRIWYLYRRQEGLSVVKSGYYFVFWAVRAVLRRV